MRTVHCVYDVSGMPTSVKEEVISFLEKQYNSEYDYHESYGSIFDANYISAQTFSGGFLGAPVHVVITSESLDTVNGWWDWHKTPIRWGNSLGRM